MINIDSLIDDYYKWLKSRTELHPTVTGWTLISTPFIGLFNDAIEIYARQEGNNILLSDDGQTLHNLKLVDAGVTRSAKRKELFNKILLNYGITLKDDSELQITTTDKDFPQKKHNLLSAILEVSDMFMTAQPIVASIFKEDVQNFLEEKGIIYTPHFIARGYTGIEFTFDFHIAYKKREIVIKAFNRLTSLYLPHFLFAWQDIKESREHITDKSISGIAIINDFERYIKQDLIEAIPRKGADYIPWTKRNEPENLQKLAA